MRWSHKLSMSLEITSSCGTNEQNVFPVDTITTTISKPVNAPDRHNKNFVFFAKTFDFSLSFCCGSRTSLAYSRMLSCTFSTGVCTNNVQDRNQPSADHRWNQTLMYKGETKAARYRTESLSLSMGLQNRISIGNDHYGLAQLKMFRRIWNGDREQLILTGFTGKSSLSMPISSAANIRKGRLKNCKK